MSRLMRPQAQTAPKSVEKEQAQGAAEAIWQGMKKGSKHSVTSNVLH
jgi:hypothetical protein